MSVFIISDKSRIDELFRSVATETEKALYVGIPSATSNRDKKDESAADDLASNSDNDVTVVAPPKEPDNNSIESKEPKKKITKAKGKKRAPRPRAQKSKAPKRETAKASEPKVEKQSTITNAEIGYINEFGNHRIPARPFLIPSLSAAMDDIQSLFRIDLNPNTGSLEILDASLNVAGLKAQSVVKTHIRDQVGFKELSPKTIAARQRRRKDGSAGTKALIDTSNFLNSITYTLDRGQGKK